jgi:hypothetical protein
LGLAAAGCSSAFFSTLAGGGGGGAGCSRSSTILASCGGSSATCVRSSFGLGSARNTRHSSAHTISTRLRMRLKRASSAIAVAHGSTEARNEIA